MIEAGNWSLIQYPRHGGVKKNLRQTSGAPVSPAERLRLGFGSKAVVTGDPTQIDLPPQKRSGLLEALIALAHTDGIAVIQFQKRDVVRHPLVQRIVAAYENHRGKPTEG